MNEALTVLLAECWEQLDQACQRTQKHLEEIGQRSKLQTGARDYIRFGYRKGKFSSSAGLMFVEIERPFSWSDSAYTWESEVDITTLTDEQLVHEWWPVLGERVREAFEADRYGGIFFDYQLEFKLYIEREQVKDHLEAQEHWINQTKLKQIQGVFQQFIADKIASPLPHYPAQKDLFFFSRLLLNVDVHPVATAERIQLCEQTDQKLAAIPKLLEEWKRCLRMALKFWANEQFLPPYIENDNRYRMSLKPADERPEPDEQQLELFIYAALRIGGDDNVTRQEFLEIASQLGSQQATQFLKEGSGQIESKRKTPHIQAQANDILQTIQLKLTGDTVDSYRDGLQYICDLMQQNFPVEYTLKLSGSKIKSFIPVKALARSALHRFFANALQYPELHPLLEQYARLVMKEFAFYNDVEPGEKSVMTGTYAVLGLALQDQKYFPLLKDYMRLVDTEHQSAHDGFVLAFLDTYPLTTELLPLLLIILAGSGQSAKPVKGLADHFEQVELALELDRQLAQCEGYEREQLMYLIFGSDSKQKKYAKFVERLSSEQR